MTKWKDCETCGEEMVGVKDVKKPVRHDCDDCKKLKGGKIKK